MRNEAQSGIKGPHGKQLILLEPPGGRRGDPVILDGTGIHSSLQIVLLNFSGERSASGKKRKEKEAGVLGEEGIRREYLRGLMH